MGGGLKGAGETDASLTSIGEGYQPAKPQYARHCDYNHPRHHLYSHVVHPGVPSSQATSGINTTIYITLKIRNVPNYLNFLFLSISSVSGYTHGVQGNEDFYQHRKIIQTV